MWGCTPVVSALQSGRREDQKFKDILKYIIHFTQPSLQEMLEGGKRRGETERGKDKERQRDKGRRGRIRGREGRRKVI